jgi:hypothetical protein
MQSRRWKNGKALLGMGRLVFLSVALGFYHPVFLVERHTKDNRKLSVLDPLGFSSDWKHVSDHSPMAGTVGWK